MIIIKVDITGESKMAKIATVIKSAHEYQKWSENLVTHRSETARRILRVGESEDILNYKILVEDIYNSHQRLAVYNGVCNFRADFFYYTFECEPGGVLFERCNSTGKTLYQPPNLPPNGDAYEVPAPEIKSAGWSRPVGDVFKDIPLGTYIHLQYPLPSSARIEEGTLVTFSDESVTLRSKTYGKENVFYFGNLEAVIFPQAWQ